MLRRIALILASALLAIGVFASPAAAGKPLIDRVDIDESFRDDFLSEVCGTDIWVDVTGHAIFRIYGDVNDPIRELNTFAIRRTIYSANGSISTVDVGPDRVWYNDDGSIDLFVTGNIGPLQVPGKGRVVANTGWTHIHITFIEEGGEIIEVDEVVDQVGQHFGDDVEVLCDVLG